MRANTLTREEIIKKGYKVDFDGQGQPIIYRKLKDGSFRIVTPEYVGAGYLQIRDLGYIQRIVYAWCKNVCPSTDEYGNDLEVDHINQKKTDNSITNLELVTKAENLKRRRHKVKKSAEEITIKELLKRITDLETTISNLIDKEQLWRY